MHIALWGALAMTAHSSQGNRKDMHIPNMGSISAARIGVRDARVVRRENPENRDCRTETVAEATVGSMEA